MENVLLLLHPATGGLATLAALRVFVDTLNAGEASLARIRNISIACAFSALNVSAETVEKPKKWNLKTSKCLILLYANTAKMQILDFFDSLAINDRFLGLNIFVISFFKKGKSIF